MIQAFPNKFLGRPKKSLDVKKIWMSVFRTSNFLGWGRPKLFGASEKKIGRPKHKIGRQIQTGLIIKSKRIQKGPNRSQTNKKVTNPKKVRKQFLQI